PGGRAVKARAIGKKQKDAPARGPEGGGGASPLGYRETKTSKERIAMVEALKKQVYQANMLLPEYRLITFTWGNCSGVDRESGLMAIKPSGVEYDRLSSEDMVLVDVKTGKKVEGKCNPSSDTATHCELYRSFPKIGGVVHTHSLW